jgi:hypothetical protein
MERGVKKLVETPGLQMNYGDAAAFGLLVSGKFLADTTMT